MTLDEIRLAEAIDTATSLGVPWEKCMAILSEAWARADPENARGPGPRAKDSSAVREGEPVFEPHVDEQGRPSMKMSYAGSAHLLPPFRARGLAAEILVICEEAETEVWIRQFFSEADNKELAEKIYRNLIKRLRRKRKEAMENWLAALTKKAEDILSVPGVAVTPEASRESS